MSTTNQVDTNLKKTNNLPWGPTAALVVTVMVYFASQLAGGLLVSLYPLFKGWNQQQTNDWLSGSVYAQFMFVLLAEAITIWFLWQFLKRRKAKLSQIGLKRPKRVDIGYALLGFGAYFFVYVVFLSIAQKLIPSLNTDQKQELGFNTHSTGIALLAVFVSLVILPPLVEEIITRGFLYTGLRSKLPKISAAIITSVLFAAAHLEAGSGKALLWVAAMDTFVLSLVLVYLREKTDRLWASIMLHMIKNSIAFVSIFVLHIS